MYKIKKNKYSQIQVEKRFLFVVILSLIMFFVSADILFAESGSSNIQEEYISILEKTNQQLSLWWNPYNTILMILTALFAIFTIIFGLTIYSQNKNYKKALDEDKKNYKQKIDEFIEQQKQYAKKLIDERNIKLKQIEANLNDTISNYEKKLEMLLKTPEKQNHQIEKIEKSIENLKAEKELLKFQIKPISVIPDRGHFYVSGNGGDSLYKCSHCGFGFKLRNCNCDATTPIVTAVCPKCGNVDKI